MATKKRTKASIKRLANRKGRTCLLTFDSKADMKRLDDVCRSLGIPRNRLIKHLIDGFLAGIDPDGLAKMRDLYADALMETLEKIKDET